MAKNNNRQKKKLVQVLLPMDLFRQFRSSEIRRSSTTDGEAIRAILRKVLDLGVESQEENAPHTA